jgi:hypothetical protein
MFTWLFAIPFIGTFLKAAVEILTPAVKGIVEGVKEWLSACWHGIKTSNYGTWTLLLTVAACVYIFTPCPPSKPCPKASACVTSSKPVTSKATNPKDTFLEWFRH